MWVVVGFVTDLLFFDETLNWTDIVGCILIIGVSFIMGFFKAVGIIE